MNRLAAVFALVILAAATTAQPPPAGDVANAVCSVPVPDKSPPYNAVTLADGIVLPGQLTGPAGGKQVVFVLPKGKAGVAIEATPKIVTGRVGRGTFKFIEEKGEFTDLVYTSRAVLRYMNKPRDGSSKDAHELSFKPFHHVFDPGTGQTLLTNGAGLAADKALTFPHHRGLFFAFNKVTYPDAKTGKDTTVDIWHGRKGEYAEHKKVLAEEAGTVFGRQRSALTWNGVDGTVIATEERELTAYAVTGGTQIDFTSEVKTALARVKLDGDPQHAGFHFRAAMEVAAKTKGQTYYVRPDGKDKPGATRNWDPKKADPRTVNLPWDACSFVVGGKRYTVLRVNHPDNPKDARGSERDYGRFGDYFEYTLTPEKPLRVKYRVWVQEGEMTVEQCAALAAGFVSPPVATAR